MPDGKKEVGVFDIASAEAFFSSAVSKFKQYQASDNSIKSTQDILYVIMVLAHLREWIAPGKRFSNEVVATSAAHQFGIDLYNQCPAYKDLLGICTATKHSKPTSTDVGGGLNIDDWPNFDDVLSFDNGPATSHVVYTKRGNITVGYDVCDLIEQVIKEYAIWFGRDVLND